MSTHNESSTRDEAIGQRDEATTVTQAIIRKSKDAEGNVFALIGNSVQGFSFSLKERRYGETDKKALSAARTYLLLTGLLLVPTLFLVLTSLFTIPLAYKYGEDTSNIPTTLLLLATVSGEIGTVLVYLSIVKRLVFAKSRALLAMQNFSKKWFFGSAAIGLAMFLGLQGCSLLINTFLPSDNKIGSSDTSTEVFSQGGFWGMFTILFLVPVLIPIIEEIVFRGVILNNMLIAGVSKYISIPLSAAIFSLAHFQGASTATDAFIVAWIFLLAVVQGIVFYKTRSIWNTIAIHVAYNGTTALITVLYALFT